MFTVTVLDFLAFYFCESCLQASFFAIYFHNLNPLFSYFLFTCSYLISLIHVGSFLMFYFLNLELAKNEFLPNKTCHV